MLLSVFVCLFMLTPGGTFAPQEATAPADVIRRFFDAYQRVDIDAIVTLLAPDVAFEDPTFRLRASGREEWRKMAANSPPAKIAVDIHSTVQMGDAIAVEMTLSGAVRTKAGLKDFKVRGASFFQVRNGLITRWTDYFDFRTFSEQTGPGQ